MENKKEQDVWFRARKYGYGWTPVTREGWFVTVVFIVLLLFAGFRVEQTGDVVSFITFLTISIAVFFTIAYKTGERPRWRWGNKRK